MPTCTASILVVDDEPDLRTLYELTLLREGYRVETAATVQQAREQLQLCRFDAVITDMRLPDGQGMELLQLLRRTPAYFARILRPSATPGCASTRSSP